MAGGMNGFLREWFSHLRENWQYILLRWLILVTAIWCAYKIGYANGWNSATIKCWNIQDFALRTLPI